jgi:sarcosine oxidase subunit alpha
LNRQINRLSAEGDHHFKGTEIDRSKPLSFRLDGEVVEGFRGDTVLSAAIASGIISAGTRSGEALGLDERFAPPVLSQGFRHDRRRALPMERAPAIDGLDLFTLGSIKRPGPVARIRQMFSGPRTSLGQRYDGMASLAGPWCDLAPEQTLTADIAIVGGGLSGLAAALAAGKSGARVILIERRQWLGGDARFFGSIGDEDSPDAMIDRLVAAIEIWPNITVLLRTEALALFEGTVRAHQIAVEDGAIATRTLNIVVPRLVLANGTIERLPIFPGNRLPGVSGTLAAFHRANRFGIWIGAKTLLSTASSVGYRVVMQAKNAGITVDRITDTRPSPQSRFIEFSKAYGIPLGRALRPIAVDTARRGMGLSVKLGVAFDGVKGAREEFNVDHFLVSGGWQPDLTLWHMAGGSSRWEHDSARLEAEGMVAGIALAGAVAGFRNAAACMQSGEAATATLFGRSSPRIVDIEIDPIHETPDDPTPIAPFDGEADCATYLDSGASLTLRPPPPQPALRVWPWRRPSGRTNFASQARPLSVVDVAAGVQLGLIPPADAAIVAQERCIVSGDIVEAGRLQKPNLPVVDRVADRPPAYLAGRFGSKSTIWLVEATDSRDFEVGCLVYPNSDPADPLAAIGVVFAAPPDGRKGGLAVIGKSPVTAGDQMMVRDISGPIAVTIIDPAKPSVIGEPTMTATLVAATLEPSTQVAESATAATVDETPQAAAIKVPEIETAPSTDAPATAESAIAATGETAPRTDRQPEPAAPSV